MEKFPRLFKRAIPFRMNIKLEEFVKEYICMEMDIHIEDLQESVMQYGRMRGKIEETVEEIRRLLQIQECYQDYDEKRNGAKMCAYQIERLEMLRLEALEQECRQSYNQLAARLPSVMGTWYTHSATLGSMIKRVQTWVVNATVTILTKL